MHLSGARVRRAGLEATRSEFWTGDQLFGFTHLEEGELVLRIELRRDGGEVVVNAQSLAIALARAKELLEAV